MFLVDVVPGKGPGPHRHPYPETFFVHAGLVRFTLTASRSTRRKATSLSIRATLTCSSPADKTRSK